MTVETALYPNQLNASWPAQSDIVREGAGHLRTVKTVFRTTFPNVAGAVSPTHVELNYMVGVTSGVQAQINTKGDIAGQTWTGTHVFPSTTTVGPLTPTIQGYLATVTSDAQAQINTKAAKAGDTYTGAHNFGGATSVTLPAATSIGSVSDVEIGYLDGVTAPVQSQLAGKADINGESYTGTHDFTGATVQVATQPAGTSDTTPASTAFVAATAFSSALPAQAGNAGKLLTTDGTNASWQLFTTLSAYGITDAVKQTVDLGNIDLNAVVTSGFYLVGTPTNGPTGFANGQLIVSRGGDRASQIAIAAGGRMWVRGASGLTGTPVWGVWRAVAFHSDIAAVPTGGLMDCSAANYFAAVVSANTTLSFGNIPSGAYSAVLEVYRTAGTITFPTGTVWTGSVPTLGVGRHLFFFQRAQLGTEGWYVSALTGYSA